MSRAMLVCLAMPLCLLLGFGMLELWKQQPVPPIGGHKGFVGTAGPRGAMLGVLGPGAALGAMPSTAPDDDDETEEGPTAVGATSGSASSEGLNGSVPATGEEATSAGSEFDASGDDRDRPRLARRLATGSGPRVGFLGAPVYRRETEGGPRGFVSTLFLQVEQKALAGRLRIAELPATIPRLDVADDPSAPLSVPNSLRIPVSIAHVVPPEAHPKRRSGAPTAGFSEDDLALPTQAKSPSDQKLPPDQRSQPDQKSQPDQRSHDQLTLESAGPRAAVAQPQVTPPEDSRGNAEPPAARLDLAAPAEQSDLELGRADPSLAKAHARSRVLPQDPSTDKVEDPSRNTRSDPGVNPESDARSTTPKGRPEQIRRYVPPIRITHRMARLRHPIDSVLRFYRDKPLNTKDDSAWSVMHSILGYGVNAPLAVGSERGRRTNAVGWMCWNNPCRGRRLLYLDGGYITGREGAGDQGHPGQFLAMLAQVRLKPDYPMRVDGHQFSVEDLIEAEKRTCGTDKELTFKLIALAHYLDSDAEWLNERGEKWNIAKMLQIEMAQPVNGAACGGTHRIMACCYAVLKREQQGQPLYGPYVAAKQYMRKYQHYAMRRLQNRDGSFSSDWFKPRRTDWGDQDRKLQTTGHILEWLLFTLPRDQLSDPSIVRATEFLTHLMSEHRFHDWEVGPRGHALRALTLYQQRVFQSQSPLARTNARQAK